ncbi:hypothetical protein B0A49_07510 [Cryomyces minteri]|uniref:Ribokinase n=1 Tax=Cryomyces minteri TaxID=331657 RepID=A0A4U0WRW7_9PEZI|nr:hypothetical protein B0A49_07510 [Cryomyces minteri]
MSSPLPVVAVIGSLNVDFITMTTRVPAAGETLIAQSFDIGFGGKGSNQAVACARLSRPKPSSSSPNPGETGRPSPSVDVRMVGAVGSDPFAEDFLAGLRQDGVNVDAVRRLDGQKTGIANIIVEEGSGENRIMVAANANYALKAETLLPIDADVAVFQLEIPLEVVLHNINEAKCKGLEVGPPILIRIRLSNSHRSQVILNPAPAVPLDAAVFKGLGHLIMNESEAAILSGMSDEEFGSADLDDIASNFLVRGVRNVIITLGAKGVFYHTSPWYAIRKPGTTLAAARATVVDTTAAGDTFVGAYAVAVAEARALDDFDVDAAVAFANRAAARTVERKGARAAVPWLDEVDGVAEA